MDRAQLTIVAEGHGPGVFREVQALQALEQFQRYMERSNPLAGGSTSGVDVIRQLYQMLEEGVPKWAILPASTKDIGNIFGSFLTSSGAPALERFVDKDLQNATLTIFFRDYTHDPIMDALERAKAYRANSAFAGIGGPTADSPP
jgi:hypothetical protein